MNRFDLVHIIRIIDRNRKFVIGVTLVCMALGLLFSFMKKKEYRAEAAFFVSNPLYADRSAIFSAIDNRALDYFGSEDDIDRVLALVSSDTVENLVITATGLDKSYGLSMDDPQQRNKLKRRYHDHIKLKRTEFKLIEVYFTDRDPELAARVANETVKQIERSYKDFYNVRKYNAAQAIRRKLNEVDSTIGSLTDSLITLRQISGIYDVISPNRTNLITGNIKSSGKDPGKYVELIQNIEANKDALVIDRSKFLSLLTQYSTGTGSDEMQLLHFVTVAKPPLDAYGPDVWIIVAAAAFIGLFFSCFYLMLTAYYREVVAK